MIKHFVEFYSPGTFFSESTTKEIDSWDVEKAIKLAKSIKERYNATPYGFRFVTRTRGEFDLDSKVSKTSNMYFLGGRIRTYEEVCAENNPKEEVLRSNMRCNKYDKVIENYNSWKITLPFKDGDVLLNYV